MVSNWMATTRSIDTRLWVNAQALLFLCSGRRRSPNYFISLLYVQLHRFLPEENRCLIRSEITNPFLRKRFVGRLITARNLPAYFQIRKNQENINLLQIFKPGKIYIQILSRELVLLCSQKNGAESFQAVGTEKHIRKHIKYVHRIPVTLSPFPSQTDPLSPGRSRKLMTLAMTCSSGVEGAGARSQLRAGRESHRCGHRALRGERGRNPAVDTEGWAWTGWGDTSRSSGIISEKKKNRSPSLASSDSPKIHVIFSIFVVLSGSNGWHFRLF